MKEQTGHLGFTLVELLLVLATLSVLASIAYVSVPRGAIQVNQATERLARTIDKARFDAVQRNNFVMIGVNSAEYCVLAVSQRSVPFDRSQDVASLPTDPLNLDCSGGSGLEVVSRVPIGGGSNPSLALVPSDDQGDSEVAALTLLIDPRGVGQRIKLAGGALVTDGEFWIRVNHAGGISRDVNVNQYGRTNQQ